MTSRHLLLLHHLTRRRNHRHNNSLSSTTITLDNNNNHQFSFYTQLQNDPLKFIATHLTNCNSLRELNQIHAHVIQTRLLEQNPAPFHYNNIIRAYTRLDSPTDALHVFISMSRDGVLPDCYTIPITLKAVCHQFLGFEIGGLLHLMAIKLGLDSNEYCESGLMSFYSKLGDFGSVRQLFDENPERKLGSWNTIIGALSQGGRAKEAIEMFMELRKSGLRPDDVTMVSVTSACANLGNLDLAFQLHKCVYQAKSIEKSDILMSNSLIDMYGKCGKMDLAYKVFSRMENRNVSSWTSMIVGYGTHGHVHEALGCFQRMREEGVRPNHVTFVGVLTACVHGGKLHEGKHFFDMMKDEYGILPKLPHYGCIVDLLGRAGLLKEAREIIVRMPMKANVVIWGCLMGACEKHGDVKMGEFVANKLIELEPWNDGVYVVLSNIYANRGMWKEVEIVRGIMKQRELAKIPACSLATTSD